MSFRQKQKISRDLLLPVKTIRGCLGCHNSCGKSQTQKDKEKLKGKVLIKNIGGHQAAETGKKPQSDYLFMVTG